MSRTYKTAPLRVRLANGYVESEPFHRHVERGVECDLTERPDPHWSSGRDKTCFWHYVYTGENLCGCPMCTAHDERRIERRRARHEAKAKARRTRTIV